MTDDLAIDPRRSHLRVSYVWRDEVMDDLVVAEPRKIIIGPRRRATFVTPDLGLPPKFAVIRPGARGYLLTLGAGMSGRLRLGGEELDVADFVERGGGDRAAGAKGAFRAAGIGPGDWGVIRLDPSGQHTLFFQFVKPDPPLPRPGWRDSELMLPALAFAVVLHALFVFVAIKFKDQANPLVFPGKRELMADYILNRPPPAPPPSVEEPRAGEEDSKEKTPPASTNGKEGKAGGEGEKPRQRAPDPDKGKPDQELPKSVQVGLLSHKSRSELKKVLDRGGFDEKLGKATARLQGMLNDGSAGGSGHGAGTGYGPGHGSGTSTRGGHGSGGGGKSFADVQTSRVLNTGGVRAAHGTPGGKGVKEVAVKVKTGSPGGDLGGLTAAEILKVLNSRKNAIKFCYDRELQRNAHLGGKVVVTWKVTASGQVMGARVSSTTVHNGRVEDCIVRQIQALHFPHPRNGQTARVVFPFIFEVH